MPGAGRQERDHHPAAELLLLETDPGSIIQPSQLERQRARTDEETFRSRRDSWLEASNVLFGMEGRGMCPGGLVLDILRH